MPVARLRLRITSTWVGSDGDGAVRSLSASQSSSSQRGFMMPSLRGSGRIRAWHKAALVLSPALFTMGKHLLGLAGGVVTLAAVAGAAALPWAALAFTAANSSSEMGAAGARYVNGLAAVERAWFKLARDTASLTLGPVTDVLNGIAAAIPKLEPLVRQVAPDFARMGRDIQAWLSGAGFERFLQNIRDYGVPAFRELVHAGVDFLATMGIGFRHFLPMARQISDELRQLAAIGRDNAQGGGFARWMKEWRSNAPKANKVLRETATALGTFFQLLDDVGPGMLRGLDTFLGALNSVDPRVLMGIIAAWATGKVMLGLAIMYRAFRALQALRRIGFLAQAAQLNAAAAALSAAGGILNALAVAINKLALMVAAIGALSVNSSALDNIKKIWDSIPKNSRVTLSAPSLNLVIVGMMGVNSTVAALRSNAGSPAQYSARIDAGLFFGIAAIVLTAWAAVRAVGLLVPAFSAIAINIAAAGAAAILAAWARVRVAAAVPVVFTATATPGNVAATASSIIAAWARVRSASAIRPLFTAMAFDTVTAGSAIIVSAWMRVVGMMRVFVAVGTVSPGNVPGASGAIRASWMRLYGLARSWHGVATCNFSGGFSGIGLSVSYAPLQGGYGPLPGPVVNFLNDIPGFGNFGTSGHPDIGLNTNPQGGDLSNPNPGDFQGGFGGYTGGQLTAKGFDPGKGKGPRGRRGDKHVHIYDDIWVEDYYQLMEVLEEAMGASHAGY